MDNDRGEELLVDRLARAVPHIEPSSFFAPRVASLAFERGARSLTASIALLAKRLVPVMTAVSIAIFGGALLADRWSEPATSEVALEDILAGGTEVGPFTLEDLLTDPED